MRVSRVSGVRGGRGELKFIFTSKEGAPIICCFRHVFVLSKKEEITAY